MRIIAAWQYKFIEKGLYSYNSKLKSTKSTDVLMRTAIDSALIFFKDEPHYHFIKEFYMKVDGKHKTQRNAVFRKVCDKQFVSEPTGWVMRREIIYRIAMTCYSLGLFNNLY